MTAEELGKFGERIAVFLWPLLRIAPKKEDYRGCDAFDPTRPIDMGKGQVRDTRIQIKADSSIKCNVFHEFYKRNDEWASYGEPSKLWRQSPSRADEYIFIGPLIAVRACIHLLAIAESGRQFTTIPFPPAYATAKGFLIPIEQLRGLKVDGMQAEIKTHDYTLKDIDVLKYCDCCQRGGGEICWSNMRVMYTCLRCHFSELDCCQPSL